MDRPVPIHMQSYEFFYHAPTKFLYITQVFYYAPFFYYAPLFYYAPTFVVTRRGMGEIKTANSLRISGLLWCHQNCSEYSINLTIR